MGRKRNLVHKPKDNMVKLNGTVIKAYSAVDFDVELNNENKTIIRAYVSGKMKVNHIRIIVGDEVDVELSPYDLTKGRIVQRHK